MNFRNFKTKFPLNSCMYPILQLKMSLLFEKKFSIWYVRKIFQKTNVSDPLICRRICAYYGVKTIVFRKSLRTYWMMIPKVSMSFRITFMDLFQNLNLYFHSSLRCLKRFFMTAFKAFTKPFEAQQKVWQ